MEITIVTTEVEGIIMLEDALGGAGVVVGVDMVGEEAEKSLRLVRTVS
jgi:hypothetical protein